MRESVFVEIERAVLLLDEDAGLDQLVHELLRPLCGLQLALAVMQLVLEVPDVLILVREQLLFAVAHGSVLLHLGPGASALARNFHQHGARALCRAHRCRGVDDGEELGRDVHGQVLLASYMLVPCLNLLAHEVGEVATDHAVADVRDPLYIIDPSCETLSIVKCAHALQLTALT